MAVNFNVTSVINIDENKTSQDPLSVSQLGFNEIVEDFCDLLEETNIDLMWGLWILTLCKTGNQS